MFDFPTTPADGTEYTSGGITYVYNATTGVWDLKSGGSMSDYVLKAGDTMTGPLTATGYKSLGDGTVGQLWVSAGDTTRTGNLEWRMVDGARQAYMGWALKSDWISFKTEDSCKGLYMTGGADLFMGDGSGLHWGNTSAKTDVNDFSEGICLYGYGSTSQFGLNITSGTLNISVQNTANKVDVNVGGTTQLRVQQGTSHMYSNFSCAGTITSTVASGVNGLSLNDGARVNFSSGCLISKVYGSNQFQHHTNANQVFTFHISGTGDVFVIDTVGSTGNSVSVTAPESLTVARELGVEADAERGVDIMKVVAACVAKIKLLEQEVATLKGAR